ncbi:MAG TPA: hypothetical protein VJB13_04275 [Candidatus Nanoarchaeia archaeon]|nr:hypothetical protein [Candidatus Nanoarchaeia archaeon]
MPIKEREIGFMGHKEQITLIYNNGKKSRLLLTKKFPPLEKKNESTILISDQDQTLYFHILRGCLQDYVTLLEKSTDSFCRGIQIVLGSYLLEENKKPEEIISEKIAPLTYDGISKLLNHFYPY